MRLVSGARSAGRLKGKKDILAVFSPQKIGATRTEGSFTSPSPSPVGLLVAGRFLVCVNLFEQPKKG